MLIQCPAINNQKPLATGHGASVRSDSVQLHSCKASHKHICKASRADASHDGRAVIPHPSRSTQTLLHNLRNGAEIHLVGTCHTSRESAAEVHALIHLVRPGTLFLELDQQRLIDYTNHSFRIAEHLELSYGRNKRQDGSATAPYLLRQARAAVQRVRVAARAARAVMAVPGARNVGINALLATLKTKIDEYEWQSKGNFMAIDVMTAIQAAYQLHLQGHDICMVAGDLVGANEDGVEAIKLQAREHAETYCELGATATPIPTEWSGDLQHLREHDRAEKAYLQSMDPQLVKELYEAREEHMVKLLLRMPGKVVAVVGAAHMDGIERLFEQYINGVQLQLADAKRPSRSSSGWSSGVQQHEAERSIHQFWFSNEL